MKHIFFCFLIISSVFAQDITTPFEKGNGNQSATYQECMAFYKKIDSLYPTVNIKPMGLTDSGENLHIVIFNKHGNFNLGNNTLKILINNGIHAGEPDGIDASMLLLKDLVNNKIKVNENCTIVIIPIYNIGGMLNRNTSSRANQNGPEAYGFRGNARNYDLNRDFIKADTKNAQSFQEIFHFVKPDVFLDNHVSNGADYQYTFTCIATQPERLGGNLSTFFINNFYPAIIADMAAKKIDMVNYVNIHGATPDDGFEQFADTPRYATGYTSLFNTLGFVPETHMLKPYKDRVKTTYEYMVSTIKIAQKEVDNIKNYKKEQLNNYKPGNTYPIKWVIDSTKVSYFNFKGYDAYYKPSEISGKNRLAYDKSKPFTKKIPFYGNYKPTQNVVIPKYYVIPKGQWHIIDELHRNAIEIQIIQKDTMIAVESYKIKNYATSKNPYEGHYGHYNTEVITNKENITFSKGDYLINTQQEGVKYLLETLEPSAVDSFFNWNFFDTILQQKEGYSAYVFEDLAIKILEENLELKTKLESLKKTDEKFANDGAAQLDWVYKNSKYYEKAHLQYPVYRVL
jgi:Zinc carboxypeptidase